MTKTFSMQDSKGVESARITVTSASIKPTDEYSLVLIDSIGHATGILKSAMGYTWKQV